MGTMTYRVLTQRGPIELSMTEFFALWERRLTLDQILLQRSLSNTS